MGLKSSRLIKLKKKRRTPVGRIIRGGATALIGIAFFTELASAIRRI